jgi:hypothetical protein
MLELEDLSQGNTFNIHPMNEKPFRFRELADDEKREVALKMSQLMLNQLQEVVNIINSNLNRLGTKCQQHQSPGTGFSS